MAQQGTYNSRMPPILGSQRFLEHHEDCTYYHRYIFSFQHGAEKLYEEYLSLNKLFVANKATERKEKVRSSPKHYFKSVAEPPTAPVSFIKRTGPDVPKNLLGTFATDKYEIDELIFNAWAPIRAGSHKLKDIPTLTGNFFRKYREHIFW